MNESTKETLLALLKGVIKTKGNQYYTEQYIDEKGIEILKNFTKNT